MCPVPEGPLFPLKASVTWSIEPAVEGIAIDKTGRISVDADVPHGTTATVIGDMKRATEVIYQNIRLPSGHDPLIWMWHVDIRVACGESLEMRAAAERRLSLRGNDWKFHVSQEKTILLRESGFPALMNSL